MLAAFRHYDNLYYQYRLGALEPGLWKAYQATLIGWLKNPGWRAWFAANSAGFSEPLQALCRDLLALAAASVNQEPDRPDVQGAGPEAS